MTDRRSFLKGILSLSVVPLLPALPRFLPVIWGDGIHDDAPGLNALLADEAFEVERGGFTALDGVIRGGIFRLSAPLVIKRSNVLIDSCVFRMQFRGVPLDVRGEGARDIGIINNSFLLA